MIWIGIYAVGAVGTAAYNLHDMVYIGNPLIVVRNAIFWPIFLPVLIVLKSLDG